MLLYCPMGHIARGSGGFLLLVSGNVKKFLTNQHLHFIMILIFGRARSAEKPILLLIEKGNEMFEKIKNLLVEELSVKEEEITLSAELVNDLGINSLELADLVLLCEEKFDVEIGDDDIHKFVTVGDVVDYLSAKADD